MEFRKLKEDEIDCRVSQIASNYCTLLLYKDARVDMNILDETVGSMNWQKHYLRDNANCIVAIYDESKCEWVEKEDTGTESFTEAEKGLASDSFKRACFNWGIGRELYTAPNIIIFPKKEMGIKGKDEFYEKDNGKYETKTRFWVEYIDYIGNKIQNIIIRDNKNNIRFTQLTKDYEEQLIKIDKSLTKEIERVEEKGIDREDIYKRYNVDSTANMLIKDKIELLERLKHE